MSLNINTKLTNNLNGYLLDGENVKDAIVVYANTSALSNIPSAVLNTGLIAYIKADESFYKYNGETWGKLYSLIDTEIVSVSTSDDYSTVNGYLSNQKYLYFSYTDNITGAQYMLPFVAKILETNTYFIYFSARIKEKVVIASVNSNDDQWNIIEEDQYIKPKESENISIANNETISDTTALQKIADKQPIYLNGRIAYYSCEANSVKQYVSICYDTTTNENTLILYKINNINIVSIEEVEIKPGGSYVEANPITPPTTTLNTVNIDNIIYQVKIVYLDNYGYQAIIEVTFSDNSTATYNAKYYFEGINLYLSDLEEVIS